MPDATPDSTPSTTGNGISSRPAGFAAANMTPVANLPFRLPVVQNYLNLPHAKETLEFQRDLLAVLGEPDSEDPKPKDSKQQQIFTERVLALMTGSIKAACMQGSFGLNYATVIPEDAEDGSEAIVRDFGIKSAGENSDELIFFMRQHFEMPVFQNIDGFVESIRSDPKDTTPLSTKTYANLAMGRGMIATDGREWFRGNLPKNHSMITVFLNFNESDEISRAVVNIGGLGSTLIFELSSEGITCTRNTGNRLGPKAKIVQPTKVPGTKGRRAAARIVVEELRSANELEIGLLLKHCEPLFAWVESVLEKIKPKD